MLRDLRVTRCETRQDRRTTGGLFACGRTPAGPLPQATRPRTSSSPLLIRWLPRRSGRRSRGSFSARPMSSTSRQRCGQRRALLSSRAEQACSCAPVRHLQTAVGAPLISSHLVASFPAFEGAHASGQGGALWPATTNIHLPPHAPPPSTILHLLSLTSSSFPQEAEYGIEIVPRGVMWEPPTVMVREGSPCPSSQRPRICRAQRGAFSAGIPERAPCSVVFPPSASAIAHPGGSHEVRPDGTWCRRRERRRQPRRVSRSAHGACSQM